MALLKQYITPHGIESNYHRLTKVEINSESQNVQMTFAVYPSEANRLNDNRPLWYEYVNIPFEEFLEDPRTVFYNASKKYLNSYLNSGINSLSQSQSLNVENTIEVK